MARKSEAGGEAVSARQARWLAIAAQGLGRDRPKAAIGPGRLLATIEQLGVLQLDAINVLERTQLLVLFSRLGPYDVSRFHGLSGPGGALFEYWAHAASLLPTDHHPLLRWRMTRHGPWGEGSAYAERVRAWTEAHADYTAAVLAEVRDRGPLTAGQLSDPRRRSDGDWWERRGLGRQALEWLFFRGDVAAWRTPNFERMYDLPERVLPDDVLSMPTPPVDEAHRRLLVQSARSLGVGTVADLADYYRLGVPASRARVQELVEAGELDRVSVEGWREPAYVPAEVVSRGPVRPRRRHATLLSPFDSLIWERKRTSRLFGFDFRIEVYVPPAKRRHGYFVLPLLVGDELVARFDVKADRQASLLRIQASWLEPGVDETEMAAAAVAELDTLRRWLGLADLSVGPLGDGADALRLATS
jgi:uncharacterized protein YcaQ